MSQRVFLRLRFESYGFKKYKIIASRAGTVSRAGARNFKAVGFEPQPEKNIGKIIIKKTQRTASHNLAGKCCSNSTRTRPCTCNVPAPVWSAWHRWPDSARVKRSPPRDFWLFGAPAPVAPTCRRRSAALRSAARRCGGPPRATPCRARGPARGSASAPVPSPPGRGRGRGRRRRPLVGGQEPRRCGDSAEREAAGGVHAQHAVEELDQLGREGAAARVEAKDGKRVGEAVELRLDSLAEAPVAGRGRLLEWEEACEEREEAHAERPDVRGEGVVRLRCEHLRRAVGLAAAKLAQQPAWGQGWGLGGWWG
jgi:hypothetical protein